MPKYRIKGPDGRTYQVTAPEGASQEEVLARVKARASQGAQQGAPAQPAPPAGQQTNPQGQPQDPQDAMQEPEFVGPRRSQAHPSPHELARSNPNRRIKSVGEVAEDVTKGMADVVITAAAETLMFPVSGYAGIINGIRTGSMERANDAVTAVNELTWKPKTELGRTAELLGALPMVAMDKVADPIAATLSFGSAEIYAGVYSTLMATPAAIPGVRTIRTRQRQRNAVNETQRWAEENNIDLREYDLQSEIVRLADDTYGGIARGDKVQALQRDLRTAYEAEKTRVDKLFEDVRKMDSTVSTRDPMDLSSSLTRRLREDGYDLEAMGSVQKRLDELFNLYEKNPSGRPVAGGLQNRAQIGEIIMVRRRATRNEGSTPEEIKANAIVRDGIDKMLDDSFHRDARGRFTAAGHKWKKAISEWREIKQRFTDDKILRDMIHKDMEPEAVRASLMGQSTMGFKPQSAAIVRNLRNALGDNHSSIRALKGEFSFHMFDDLLKPEPNLQAFVRKYDSVMRNHKSVVKELGLDTSDLRHMRDLADAAVKTRPRVPMNDLHFNQLVARFTIGHGIAKAGAKVSLLTRALEYMSRTGGRARNRVLQEITGAKLNQPFISKRSAAAAALIASGVNNEFQLGYTPQEVKDSTIVSTAAVRQQDPEDAADMLRNPGRVLALQGGQRDRMIDQIARGENYGGDDYIDTVHPDPVHGMDKPTIGYGINLADAPLDKDERAALAEMRGLPPSAASGLSKPKRLTKQEARKLLEIRVGKMEGWLREEVSPDAFLDLNDPRKAVLHNMRYNMGATRFNAMTWEDLFKAIEDGQWDEAAKQMLVNASETGPSDWAIETKGRALELAEQMRTGKWQSGPPQ